MAEFNGDGSDNVLTGTATADTITGNGGSDTINAAGGDDIVYGDDGDDIGPDGVLIYQNDFSSSAAGWTIPATRATAPTDSTSAFYGPMLGRFAGTSNANDVDVDTTFTLDGAYDDAIIEFDFHRIDSWDNEQFQIYINGEKVYVQAFWSSTASGGSGTFTLADGTEITVALTSLGPTSQKGFWTGTGWANDQSFHVKITVEDAPATLKLGIGSTIQQGLADESYGIDNVVVASTNDITANAADFLPADDIIHGDDGNDTLVITEAGATVAYDANPENGTVSFLDGATLTFTNIEQVVVPCFTPGTRIKTAMGQVPVQDLQVGDMVETLDNGLQPIRWIGCRKLSAEELDANPNLHQVLIRAGAIDGAAPARDMLVSPQHNMMIRNPDAQPWFGTHEVLVKAKDMTHKPGMDRIDVPGLTCIHIMFDQHEIILADNSWTESFRPGDMLENVASRDTFAELLDLFPELGQAEGRAQFAAARMLLKKHEARLIA